MIRRTHFFERQQRRELQERHGDQGDQVEKKEEVMNEEAIRAAQKVLVFLAMEKEEWGW